MSGSSTSNAAMGLVFPLELFLSIVEHISDLESFGTSTLSDFSRLTLSNLRLVNKAVHDFVTPHLFHTIITWLEHYQRVRLECISNQENLRHHIKRIVFRPWEVRNIGYGNYLNEIWCCDIRTHNRLKPAELTYKTSTTMFRTFRCFRYATKREVGI